MVLEIKVPQGSDWNTLQPMIPIFLSYLISFLLVGIYWGNHHHLLHTLKHINSGIILANLNLLFWLSLIPFGTGWMGENHFAPNTIIIYATLLVLCGISYNILQYRILKMIPEQTVLIKAIKKQNTKVVISLISDIAAIPLAYVHPAISGILFFFQSAIWLIPDPNIEKALKD
jgi:uncharacterized membrane protein